MKKKKLSKKLSLNRKTIATLSNGDLNYARGGLSGFDTNCGYTNCGYGCFTFPAECNSRDISCYYCGPVIPGDAPGCWTEIC
jgi:hypothetical protein